MLVTFKRNIERYVEIIVTLKRNTERNVEILVTFKRNIERNVEMLVTYKRKRERYVDKLVTWIERYKAISYMERYNEIGSACILKFDNFQIISKWQLALLNHTVTISKFLNKLMLVSCCGIVR
jgi:hypothetical protein